MDLGYKVVETPHRQCEETIYLKCTCKYYVLNQYFKIILVPDLGIVARISDFVQYLLDHSAVVALFEQEKLTGICKSFF